MKEIIELLWDDRGLIDKKEYSDAVLKTIELLDKGAIRIAEKVNNDWVVNDWIKKAVILYFPLMKMKTIEIGPFEFHDKIPLKKGFEEMGIRVVPHAICLSLIHI